MRLLLGVLTIAMQRAAASDYVTNITFIPSDFMMGVATSAYQIEGAWNESGKGMNIWDTFVHTRPDMIADKSTGDVTADSYHKWQEDVNIVRELHVDFYRFSISWSRILPTGELNSLNKAGIDYYKNLINELTKHNITCMVAMYHWDLPQKLQDLGGWANPILADFFEDYARILYSNFGDKVKWWVTMVELNGIINGYSVSYEYAPGIDSPRVGVYLAARTLLLAHARAFHLYKNEFFDSQRGHIGIALDGTWYGPEDKTSKSDQDAAEFAIQYHLGMFANPIFSSKGDYPQVVKDRIQTLSLAQGYPRSRLRNFTENEIEMIKGSSDFLGINYYTARLVKPGSWTDVNTAPDDNVTLIIDKNWPTTTSPIVKVMPAGLRSILRWIKENYKNPPVLITENGYPDEGTTRDIDRVKYIVRHMHEVFKAKNEDGCKVMGYTVWSLMDSFEWNRGYKDKFGLYSVDLKDSIRSRKQKNSALCFAEIIMVRKLPSYTIKDSGEMEIHMDFLGKTRNQQVTQAATKGNASVFANNCNYYKGQSTHVWFAVILCYLWYKHDL